MLTREQLDQFEEEGCIAIPGVLAPETVAGLLAESKRLIREFDLDKHPFTKFETGDDEKSHVGDDYFLQSSNKISFFFEPDSIVDGKLVKPKDKAVNKVGHGLHFLNDKFNSVTVNSFNANVASQLGFKDPKVLQSMVICKQPSIGGKVPPHQDGEFLYTRPQSCIGFWYALEDCTPNNGCLSYIPGSHKTSKISRRFVSTETGTKFVVPETGEEFVDFSDEEAAVRNSDNLFKSVEIPSGTLVLIHSNVIHKSEKNLSDRSRYAYTFHLIEGEYEYDKFNWLQIPPEKPVGSVKFTPLRVKSADTAWL